MSKPLPEFLTREYEYLRERKGREFFLALGPYVTELDGRPEIHEILCELRAEMQAALQRFVDEQNAFTDEADAIRTELAQRAPEIDNSDMEKPDVRSHAYTAWDLDSFARFDDLVERGKSAEIGYPLLPDGASAPGVVPRLLQILRGRLRAAEYGEDASDLAVPTRQDLGDLGQRITNLSERERASVQRYLQESQTLPALAFARLVEFGSDLVAEPVAIETDEDVERFLDGSIREWGRPKTIARKIANGERMEDWEQRYGAAFEQTLKSEAERLHREFDRRLEREDGGRRAPLSADVIRTVEVTPLSGIFDRTRTLGKMPEGDALTYTEFIELMLARLYDVDRERPGDVINLSDLTDELKQEIPASWSFDAVQVLADRGLVEDMRTMQTATVVLTGEGRLFVERGGATGVIDEYRQHPTNFVVVTGSSHQVAVGVGGGVSQTSVKGHVPDEAWELLDQIENSIESAEDLSHEERQEALADVETARAQLKRPEPNKRAALALLDPLAKVASVASLIVKLGELLT